ncbi:hypothetical protein [Ruegeria sp.]|uniref:hypothetical protein n=1 Tax=Ruegeria sp. TaxID=1879320 RepID=UPI003C7AEC04
MTTLVWTLGQTQDFKKNRLDTQRKKVNNIGLPEHLFDIVDIARLHTCLPD